MCLTVDLLSWGITSWTVHTNFLRINLHNTKIIKHLSTPKCWNCQCKWKASNSFLCLINQTGLNIVLLYSEALCLHWKTTLTFAAEYQFCKYLLVPLMPGIDRTRGLEPSIIAKDSWSCVEHSISPTRCIPLCYSPSIIPFWLNGYWMGGCHTLVPERKTNGRPANVARRTLLNAIFYMTKTGCGWGWKSVYHYFRV